MNYRFDIRIETGAEKSIDTFVSAGDLSTARQRIEARSNFREWDWRGAVAFVNGKKPAEENIKTRAIYSW